MAGKQITQIIKLSLLSDDVINQVSDLARQLKASRNDVEIGALLSQFEQLTGNKLFAHMLTALVGMSTRKARGYMAHAHRMIKGAAKLQTATPNPPRVPQHPKLVYVSGAYTPVTAAEISCPELTIMRNVNRAIDVAKKVLLQGHIPIVPHALTRGWDIDRYDSRFTDWEHEDWMVKYALPLMERCDVALFTLGWRDSRGCRIEHGLAVDHAMPIAYEQGGENETYEFAVPVMGWQVQRARPPVADVDTPV